MKTKPVTLITGAAQGIGAAIAKRLAQAGHNIALNYFSNHAKAQLTMLECERLGAQVLLLQADVSEPAECQRVVAATIEHFGRVDLLVNNAGVASFSSTPIFDLESQSLEPFNKIFSTNVLSVLALSQAVSSHMRKQGRGVIINISSVAGLSGATNSSIIYAASKGALNTLTLTLAKCLAPTIRVNAICPAMVDSSWWEKRFPDQEQRAKFIKEMRDKNPLGKVITSDEVANTVLFLFETTSMNGELIRIDSGAH